MFLPRIGQEVIVDFLEGDPDRPLIIGRVYNNDNMPPYGLPEHKTRSTIKGNSSKDAKGCNEIRFEDLKGKEQLFLQAQGRMDTRVKGSHYHTMGGSYHLSVGGYDGDGELAGEYREWVAKAKHVYVEGEVREEIVGDVSRFVEGNVSDRTLGTKSTGVEGDAAELYEKDHIQLCYQTEEIMALNMRIEAMEVLELKCGATSIVLTPGVLYINSPSVLINSEPGPTVPGPLDELAEVLDAEIAGSADLSKPGQDVRYDGNGEMSEDEVEEVTLIGRNARREDQTSWIELEMVDDADRPWPGEPFDLKLPNGRIRSGRLNKNGFARIERILPGGCEVRFPNLDAAAWERI
jgi:type VI secretion system secreted protein VgrG